MFIDTLKERQARFESLGLDRYRQDAMPEVYAHYKAFMLTGKFPYLNAVRDYIVEIERLNITGELLDYLKTEVYLAGKQYDNEQKAIYKAQMLADGWQPITQEAIKTEVNQGHTRLYVKAKTDGAIFTSNFDEVFKPFVNQEGHCYLMHPRATRRGMPVSNLYDAFYKVKV